MIRHLALIMDGNRRWAQKNGLRPWLGHRQGAETIETILKFCKDNRIAYVSLYAYSIENLHNRPAFETNYVFNELLVKESGRRLQQFLDHDVRVRFLGDSTLFDQSVLPTIQMLQEKTQQCKKVQLNILFCYGARQELVSSVKKIVQKVQGGFLSLNDINEKTISDNLWTADIPEPDLIIRTGSVKRLSNFLLYQSAYSELYFLDILWPEITEAHLEEAVQFYNRTQRNFGI